MILAQRQTPGEDWVVVGRGDQEEAADDEQQQKVRLGVLEVTADDQRPVRWEGVWGWGLEATADDQRPVLTTHTHNPSLIYSFTHSHF